MLCRQGATEFCVWCLDTMMMEMGKVLTRITARGAGVSEEIKCRGGRSCFLHMSQSEQWRRDGWGSEGGGGKERKGREGWDDEQF